MSRRHGGAQRWYSNLHGLRTKYENGLISRDALVRALRRYADERDAQAEVMAKLLPTRAAHERKEACLLRKQADKLEQEDDYGR